MTCVLIVEDDPQVLRVLRTSLLARGYEVHSTPSVPAALAATSSLLPDLVILSLGLPGCDGVAFIRGVRRWSRVPILVLAGWPGAWDRVEVLDAGADDLVTKPFEINELMARVGAICRRTGRNSDVAQVSLGELTVDIARHVVTARDGEIPLTATEWKLLEVLVRNMGRLMTKTQLLTEVWGPDHVKEGHYLRVYVNHLRHKLEADPARPRHLVTEPGLGYRLSP
jgi:two-component system KDP operon response regulator KdpE